MSDFDPTNYLVPRDNGASSNITHEAFSEKDCSVSPDTGNHVEEEGDTRLSNGGVPSMGVCNGRGTSMTKKEDLILDVNSIKSQMNNGCHTVPGKVGSQPVSSSHSANGHPPSTTSPGGEGHPSSTNSASDGMSTDSVGGDVNEDYTNVRYNLYAMSVSQN